MRKSRPIKVMKHLAAALLCALALRAEPVLLVHDATGVLLRQAPAVLKYQRWSAPICR